MVRKHKRVDANKQQQRGGGYFFFLKKKEGKKKDPKKGWVIKKPEERVMVHCSGRRGLHEKKKRESDGKTAKVDGHPLKSVFIRDMCSSQPWLGL